MIGLISVTPAHARHRSRLNFAEPLTWGAAAPIEGVVVREETAAAAVPRSCNDV